MDITTWYRHTVGDDSHNQVAKRSGINQSTITRQLARGTLSPETIVPIARAYHADVIGALIIQGLLTPEDVDLASASDTVQAMRREEIIASLTDMEVADLVWERLTGHDQHPTLTEPLDHVPDPEDTYEPEPEPGPGPDTEPADAYQDDYATAAAQYDTPTDWDDASMMDDGA